MRHKFSETGRSDAGVLSIRQVFSMGLSAIYAPYFSGYFGRKILARLLVKSRVRMRLANALAVILLLFCYSTQAAILGEMIRPFLSYTMLADDNILRIRDQLDAQALLGTNNLFDISQRITAGAIFNKQINRQHLSANGSWSRTRFEKFSQMNNNAIDLRSNWNWFLGNRLEGNMGVNFSKGQAPFLFQPGVKSIRTQKTQFINAAWHFHPSWKLRGDYSHFNFKTDNPILSFQNRAEDRFETGLDYIASSGSTFGIQYRNIQGKFTAPTNISENNYIQNEIKGKINWILTGKSRVEFLGGWVERKNSSFSSSDFSGLNARLTYNWQPTGKIDLRLSGWRETVPIQSLNANFSLITGTSVLSVWNLTERTKVTGDFSYRSQKIDSFTGSVNQTSRNRQVNIFSASIELSFKPTSNMEVSTSVFHNSLSTNSSRGGFNANGANINLHYTLGRP